MLSTTDPLQIQGHIQTESEGTEKSIPCKQKYKKVRGALLISEQTNFKIRNVTGDKDGHYIIISVVNETEVDVFWESLTFDMIQHMLEI